jgi:5-methyltetrahydropteroyltriglutamate--homocysteine methyltransferase
LSFRIARGLGGEDGCGTGQHESGSAGVLACEMTKWFDTNYHYIVPEFETGTRFSVAATKPFDEFLEALELGIRTKPVLIGPLTACTWEKRGTRPRSTHPARAPASCLRTFFGDWRPWARNGCNWTSRFSPSNLSRTGRPRSCQPIKRCVPQRPGQSFSWQLISGIARESSPGRELAVDALHCDLTRAAGELQDVVKCLALVHEPLPGVVDGRNVWRNNFELASADWSG